MATLLFVSLLELGDAALDIGLHLLRAFVLWDDGKHLLERSELVLRGLRLSIPFFGLFVLWSEICGHGTRASGPTAYVSETIVPYFLHEFHRHAGCNPAR